MDYKTLKTKIPSDSNGAYEFLRDNNIVIYDEAALIIINAKYQYADGTRHYTMFIHPSVPEVEVYPIIQKYRSMGWFVYSNPISNKSIVQLEHWHFVSDFNSWLELQNEK